MVKQICNGLFNALVADLIITYVPLMRLLGKKDHLRPISLQQSLSQIFVAFVFVPAMLFTILSSHEALRDIEVRVPATLQAAANQAVSELGAWRQQQQAIMAELALLARQADGLASEELQQSTRLLQRKLNGSDRIYVTNAQNAVIASSPSPPMRPLSAQESLKLLEQPNDVRLVQSSPIHSAEPATGEIVIETQVDFIANILQGIQQSSAMTLQAALLRGEQVIEATRPDLEAMSIFGRQLTADSRLLNSDVYQWLPSGDMPTFVKWRKSVYVRAVPLDPEAAWTLVVEAPAEPHFQALQIFYIERMGLTVVIVLGAIVLSYGLSNQLVKPIQRLALVTTDLPNKLTEQEKIHWPKSKVLEMQALIANFKGMAQSLEQQFHHIRETNAVLEERVVERTQVLVKTNQALQAEVEERQRITEALQRSETDLRQQKIALETSMIDLQQAQTQLVQAEKMSSLGQLVAGIAHEINNPVNFIHGNLSHVKNYTDDLLALLALYEDQIPEPSGDLLTVIEDMELDFLKEDLPKILSSMKLGTERIRQIVLSLRNFSRTDESSCKAVDLHEGLESTLLILQYRLKAKPEQPAINVIKQYGDLPPVECYPGQINQVFMNILSNAIDAIEETRNDQTYANLEPHPGAITIATQIEDSAWVTVRIMDDGSGMPADVQKRIFEPFFTTKEIGKGTGMGMSISYQIVTDQHQGQISCNSLPDQGTEFVIRLPIRQPSSGPSV
ncbi:MAG: hypothetical protein F6K00_16355 [Leptolyngbya sp. SIOISBB]|nr:hypothetical protein [Leptolyngbya sp. SIOISBB]